MGKPFTHEACLSVLTELRDKLKEKLSAGHDEGNGEGQSASELADRIKTLKAANTIEAAPQRVQRKQATAEEPITVRIRRGQIESTVSDQAIASEAPTQNSPGTPQMTFEERIALERQRKNDGEGHSTG